MLLSSVMALLALTCVLTDRTISIRQDVLPMGVMAVDMAALLLGAGWSLALAGATLCATLVAAPGTSPGALRFHRKLSLIVVIPLLIEHESGAPAAPSHIGHAAGLPTTLIVIVFLALTAVLIGRTFQRPASLRNSHRHRAVAVTELVTSGACIALMV